MSSDRNKIFRGGWSSGGISKVRISSKSVERFPSCGGRNLRIPIDLVIGLYNSLYYGTSRDAKFGANPSTESAYVEMGEITKLFTTFIPFFRELAYDFHD